MVKREIRPGVFWAGAVDWDRRLFDALIPLPDGTSYNAYLVRGREKTALLDAVDPGKLHLLEAHLADVPRLDYLIAHHAEQDHSGGIPFVLRKYPEAVVLASAVAKPMLVDHLGMDAARIRAVADGEKLELGGKTQRFIDTPWVNWPETMSSYLEEDRILFSCDFFGSHLATNELYVVDEGHASEEAKRYYAEIMMPFRKIIQKNMEKIGSLDIDVIAPSHGPLYKKPRFIMDAYRDWSSDTPKNETVLAYVSMHGSTAAMVEHFVGALTARGVAVRQFYMPETDIGKMAMSLVDAATIVIAAPTVHTGPHPAVVSAAVLANALRPKLKFAAVIGSYGWASKAVEHITALIPNLRAEMLPPVMAKGMPRPADFQALDALAETIAQKHKSLGLL